MKSWRLRLLLLLTGISVFLSVNQRELYVGDETKYGQVIRSMHAEHSFLVPMLNGSPYSHKPPIHFWLIYLLTDVFGMDSTWPFVLPSLAAFLSLMAILFWIGRQMFDEEAAVVAAFVFSSFYLVWGLAQTARMDLEFTAMISIAVLYIWRFLLRSRQRDLTLAGLFVGIAILIKGPMALVMVLVTLIFELIRRRRFPRVNPLPALGLAAAIPLAWVVPAVIRGGKEYAHDLLWKQNVDRAIDSFAHKEPVWFYVLRSPGTFAPWAFLGILGIVAVYRRDQPEWGEALRFCVSWLLAVLVPFTLISGKLDVYMVPAAVPLALIAGRFITDLREDSMARWGIMGNRVLTSLYVIFGITIPLIGARYVSLAPELNLMGTPLVRGLFISTVAVAAAGLVAQFLIRNRKLFRSSVIFGLVALWPAVYLAACLMPLARSLSMPAPSSGATTHPIRSPVSATSGGRASPNRGPFLRCWLPLRPIIPRSWGRSS
jgi:4-amino-4-deoxy-L-arabinose transferase-like glycosyltransferase